MLDRTTLHRGLTAVVSAVWVAGCTCNAPPPRPHIPPPEGEPETIVLIVLDTVRADHTSLCGYERPTTPVLAALGEQGASSCAVKATSNWTVPSHASFFTGLHVIDHGAGMGRDRSQVEFGVRPLRAGPQAPETLAEQLAGKGYQTALVSANGLVGPETGLSRGYDSVHVKGIGHDQTAWSGTALAERVRETLSPLNPNAPLFLTVNVLDAHDPWEPIPKDVGWVPPRTTLPHYRMRKLIDERRLRGAKRAKRLAHVTDLYDYGVSLADQRIDDVLTVLDEGGWRNGSWRLVVTSDHGEFLGEHDRLLHNGEELYEPVVSIPVVYVDSDGGRPGLPAPASGLVVHELLRTGQVGALATDVRAQHLSTEALEALSDHPCTDVTAAIWDGDTKALCLKGTGQVFDLKEDPAEKNPRPVGFSAPDQGDPLVERLREDIDALETLNRSESEAASVTDQLRELGYIE